MSRTRRSAARLFFTTPMFGFPAGWFVLQVQRGHCSHNKLHVFNRAGGHAYPQDDDFNSSWRYRRWEKRQASKLQRRRARATIRRRLDELS